MQKIRVSGCRANFGKDNLAPPLQDFIDIDFLQTEIMTAMPPKEEKVDHAFYEELQSQLKEALNAKKAADKALSGVEDKIEKFEGTIHNASSQ